MAPAADSAMVLGPVGIGVGAVLGERVTAFGVSTRAHDPFSLRSAAVRSSRRGSHPSSHPDRNLRKATA